MQTRRLQRSLACVDVVASGLGWNWVVEERGGRARGSYRAHSCGGQGGRWVRVSPRRDIRDLVRQVDPVLLVVVVVAARQPCEGEGEGEGVGWGEGEGEGEGWDEREREREG